MITRRHVAAALGCLSFVVTCAVADNGCGGSSSPSTATSPSPPTTSSNFHGSFSSSNYAPATLDVALTATGSGATQSAAGSYSTSNGITGQVSGTITGSLTSGGTFLGTLTYATSPLGGTNCNGTGSFSGSVSSSSAGINWTSIGFHSNCAGDPTGIGAIAATGGTGPVATPPAASVNVTGTWGINGSGINGSPSLVLSQTGNIVTGSDTVNPSAIVGAVSGSSFTFTVAENFFDAVNGRTTSCSDLFSLTATVQGTTMTGNIVLAAWTCPSVAPPYPIGTGGTFTGTKQ
jgi:hypothetical protein